MKTSGVFYQEVVKAIILCGSETWVITAPMMKYLDSAYVGFSVGMAHIDPRRELELGWGYLYL